MSDVKNISIKEINPYENNPRNNKDAVDSVAESIKNYGFLVSPVMMRRIAEQIRKQWLKE